MTPEMYDLAGRMINNPDESWWVALHAIEALGRATPDVIGGWYEGELLKN